MSPQAFPHLLPAEGLIWARFLQLHGAEWDRFEYDVHVGQGHPIDPNWPDYIKRMVRKLSPQRIDVVGWKGGMPTIFEVSPRLGSATVGHLLMYRYLFTAQFPGTPRPELVAVGPRIHPDVALYLASEGVRVVFTDSIVPV